MTSNYETCGRKLSCSILREDESSSLEGPSESLKSSVRIHGLRVEIESRYVLRTKQEC